MQAAAGATSTGLQAFGDIYQGQQNAAVSDFNANVATTNAQITENQGAEEAQQSLVQSRKAIGAGAAEYGASGTGAGGSAQWVLRAGAQQGALTALTIQNNAAIKSTAYENEAALDQFKAANDITAGEVSAATAILGASAGNFGGGGGTPGGSPSVDGSGASTASSADLAEVAD
jgi:hypothetical protein